MVSIVFKNSESVKVWTTCTIKLINYKDAFQLYVALHTVILNV